MPANQVSADYAVVIAREAQKRGTDLLFNTPFTLKVLEQLEFVPLEPFIELLARFTELYQDRFAAAHILLWRCCIQLTSEL